MARDGTRISVARSYTESVAYLSRTCVLAFLCAGGVLAACGHLPFDDAAQGDAGGASLDGGLVDADGRDGDIVTDRDGGRDAADGGCAGPDCVGTFVSGAVGDDTNPGTSAQPVKTIARATEIALTLGGQQNVFVAGAHYPEKVTLNEGVDLLGGYECSALPCSWAHEILKNDTAILNPDYEGVLAPKTVTRKTSFDGFRVMGKAGPPTASPGSAAISIVGGTPTIKRCRIFGGDVTGGAPSAKRSVGVAILGAPVDSAGALLANNSITGGASTDDSVGVLFDKRPAAAVAVLIGNVIKGGTGSDTAGVIALVSGPGTVLKDNVISGGSGNNGGSGSSWGIVVRSTMTIDGNAINTDVANAATCSGVEFCGGIQSLGATAVITNNVVRGAKGARTCAVMLAEGEVPAGSVVLNANTLDGAGAAGADGTSSTAIVLRVGVGTSAKIGTIRNNILLGGNNKNRFGVFEESSPGKTVHAVALDNNDFWNAGVARNDSAYRLWDGATGTNLIFTNFEATLITPLPSANIDTDPLLDATYHLQPNSPCIDKGTATEAPPRDRDGDTRPKGGAVDIGADEAK